MADPCDPEPDPTDSPELDCLGCGAPAGERCARGCPVAGDEDPEDLEE